MAIIVKKQPKTITNRNNGTSSKMKALLFKYFRFERKMHCISEFRCEYANDIEDIIAFTKFERICVEIKISKNDFLADFKTKEKHANFAKRYTKFYFCVTQDLRDFVLEYLKDYPNYGLLIFNESGDYFTIYVAKKAKDNKATHFIRNIDELFRRMSSELANLKQELLK
ncbi:hypothetical protein [Campylobacter sp. CN_NA1]|uniref:hypothetical protein n=1 Tax=Campylobacter sp. CN_NA1 TaxID=2984150 RepID=UPI0022E9BA5B|nr:hypothetical protein [Campylobacter sp. CN_NA1]MDA3056444.1 hypothetical protein [Campylobacter sp. CN_NA1]